MKKTSDLLVRQITATLTQQRSKVFHLSSQPRLYLLDRIDEGDLSKISSIDTDLARRWKNYQAINDFAAQVLEEERSANNENYVGKILPFIEWKLRMFSLSHLYDAHDIFLECYCRAVHAIEADKELRNIPAWFKSTAFHVICERSRKEKKLDTEPLGGKDFSSEVNCDASDETKMRLLWLLEALTQLSHRERELLWLRMQGLTYEKIAKKLGGTEASLRQQVSRTIKRLRKMMP